MKKFWPKKTPPVATPSEPEAAPSDFNTSDQLTALKAALEHVLYKLPEKVQSDLTDIYKLIEAIDLLQQRHKKPLEQRHRMDFEGIITVYIQECIQNYLKVPSIDRGNPIIDGKTAIEVLIELLGFIKSRLQQIKESYTENNQFDLLVTYRFLKDKFR